MINQTAECASVSPTVGLLVIDAQSDINPMPSCSTSAFDFSRKYSQEKRSNFQVQIFGSENLNQRGLLWFLLVDQHPVLFTNAIFSIGIVLQSDSHGPCLFAQSELLCSPAYL